MDITKFQIFLIFFISFIIGIDAILDEFQIHRPIISCTLIGMIMHDVKTGIFIGGTLEMISLGWMNVGAAISPDTALSSIVSTILVIAGKQSIGSGIAVSILLATAGQVLTIIVRTIAVFFQHAADNIAKKGNFKNLSRIHILALFLQAMRVSIPSLIVSIFVNTSKMQYILNSIPKIITNGLNISSGLIVVIGYAMVVNMMKSSHLMPFFYLGFVIAAFSNFNLIALGVIGLIIATLYIQLSYKNSDPLKKDNTFFTGNNDSSDNELD